MKINYKYLFAFLAVVPVCAHAAQPKQMQEVLKDQELIALKYPHEGMDVGALRWGDPIKPATSTMPPASAFSKTFLDGVARARIEAQNFEKRRHLALNAAASPGPRVLAAAQLACGDAAFDVNRCKLTRLDWGELHECTVDIRNLSEAMVRGWYNLPGKALHNNALFQLELDSSTNALRPWVVVRSVIANGLKYEMNKDSSANFKIGAGHVTYGKGELGLQYKALTSKTLEIQQPMVIGYDVAYLARIDPPMPRLSSVKPGALGGNHDFYWKLRGSREPFRISIDAADLRARDAREMPAAETRYAQPVVEKLEAEIERAQPARLALLGETKPRSAPDTDWRRVEEGSTFRSDELLRLRLLLDEPAHIYILAKDGADNAAVLYPKAAGQGLSIGEDKPVVKGEWLFPSSVNGDDGLVFNNNDPSGTESFIVVAAKAPQPALLSALADFARAATEASMSDANLRGRPLGLRSIVRLPVGTAKSTAAALAPSAGPSEPVERPAATITQPESAAIAPRQSLEVLFSGIDSATVLTLNLVREQVPPTRGAVGLRLPAGYTNSSSAPPVATFTAIDVMDYYQTMPPGLYNNVWGIFVGITNYQQAAYNNLLNAARDAQQLSAAFVEVCGMREPIVLLDDAASHAGLEDALRKIGERDSPGDLFIFHFSGHGFGAAENDTGYMLLHDAPLPERFSSGRGIIEMNLLQRMAESAGIDAKHQFYILDCCYSGMAMAPKIAARSVLAADANHANISDMLTMRAAYVISAGRKGQPVLDGPAGAEGECGHGLLSGFIVQALREPGRFSVPTKTFEGVELIPTRQLFSQADEHIRAQARQVWQGELRRSEQRSTPLRLACRNGSSASLGQLSYANDLTKLTQGPQDGRFGSEAWVYLPIRKGVGAPSAAPSAEGAAWCENVSRQYTPDYARRLERVFTLLGKGQPPSAKRHALEVEAELLRRPRIDDAMRDQIIPLSFIDRKYPHARDNNQKRAELRALELERWRSANSGMQWEPLRQRGDAASLHYELRFQLINRGAEPVHYYLIQLDQVSVFQWLAPRNNSWRDDQFGEQRGCFTHGPAQLTSASPSLCLPANLTVEGQPLTFGWPIEDDSIDLQFYVVVTPARWPELETALNEASSAAWELFESEQKRKKKPFGRDLPHLLPGTRALGAVQHKIFPSQSSASSANSQPPMAYRTDQGLLMLSWTVDVRSANELVPQIASSR